MKCDTVIAFSSIISVILDYVSPVPAKKQKKKKQTIIILMPFVIYKFRKLL